MATAILSSRNSLNHRFDHESLIHRNPNPRLRRPSHAATTTPRRPKRSSAASQSKTLVIASPAASTNLVMGQVKILKRGESLTAFRNSCADRDVGLIAATAKRIGPEPETRKKQIGGFKGAKTVSVVYAGSCNSVSPPPNSLPIPCFLEKKN